MSAVGGVLGYGYFILITSIWFLCLMYSQIYLMADDTKRMFITKSQKTALVEYIKKSPELISGKFSNSFTFKDATKKWTELANILNSIPGATKNWKGWRKTWHDMRTRTKVKTAKNNAYRRATGGGPFIDDTLTKTEEDILEIIKIVSVNGYTSVTESNIEFDYDNNLESNIESTEENTDPNIQINEVVAHNNFTINSSDAANVKTYAEEKNILKCTPKKKQTQLVNSAKATEFFQRTYKEKIMSKEKYQNQKLEVLQKIAAAKERSAAAKERSAAAQERISEILEEFL